MTTAVSETCRRLRRLGSIALLLAAGSASMAAEPVGLLFDEDLTDGAFDDYGAWPGAWSRHGQAAFRSTNGRPATPLAMSSRPQFLSGPWRDRVDWSVSQGSGPIDLPVHKERDVVIAKFTAFSDIARSSMRHYGVEVAMLDDTDDPAYQGHPHFGHDLSFEAFQSFSSWPFAQQQLEANVENQQVFDSSAKLAHHPGPATDATLSTTYENLVVWRNQPGTGRTNIEQWATSLAGDYEVLSEMTNALDPAAEYATFNRVQTTFFRNRDPEGELLREGVSAPAAQIGATHLHVGITRRTDFNLDYGVGVDDYFAWAAGFGLGGKTILDGDANNDGDVGPADLLLLAEDWGVGQQRDVTRYAYDAPVRVTSDELVAEVNTATGRVRLRGDATPLLAFKLTSDAGLVAGALEAPTPAAAPGLAPTSSDSEASQAGLSGDPIDTIDLGEIYDTQRAVAELQLTWQAGLGEPTRVGEVVFVSALPGDHNGDGVVDGADYTAWRDTPGADPAGYATWISNFGRTTATVGTGVPEPTNATLLVAGLTALSRVRRCPRSSPRAARR